MANRRRFLTSAVTASAVIGPTWAATFPGAFAGAVRKPIRTAQLGTRHAHASKLSVFRKSPEFEVLGVCEPDPAARAAAQQDPTYSDLPWLSQEQLLNLPGLELVLVETEVRGLLDAAEACVNAGKHVHLDKPAGESLPQYRRILANADRQKLLVQMGYMYRYNPGVVLLREFLQQGWLGDVFEVHAVMSKVVDQATRRQLAQYRGGIFFELACHVTDLVVGILGQPVEVTPFHQQVVTGQDQLLDNMLSVLRYPHALATVKSSAQEVEGFARRHLVVCGTQGTLQIEPLDDPRVRLALTKPIGKYGTGVQTIDLPKYSRYVDDAADIARVIRGESPAQFSSTHDLAVQETVLRSCGLPLN